MHEPVLQLELLYTPLEECLVVDLGVVEAGVLARMQAAGFDDAPVLSGGKLLGVVSAATLSALLEDKRPLSIDALRVTDRTTWLTCSSRARVSATHLLAALVDERCTIVCDPAGSVLHAVGPARGFLTISDLNRHVFRAALYAALAALEARLAAAIQSRFDDPWTWIKSLSEEHQVRILGYWELSKRNGLDVGPIAALTLTNLLAIAGQNKNLLTDLGFASRSAFDKAVGSIPSIRNAVMHPVRPLIAQHQDVRRVLAAIRAAMELHDGLLTAAV